MYSLIHLCSVFATASELPAPIASYLRMQQHMAMLVESAGLFWIGAELAILFLIFAGRRHVDSESLPARFVLAGTERRRAITWGAAFVVLATVVLGRYALSREIDIQALSARIHTHLLVWAAFVTTWVVLETLIVYHGWRGYRRLRVLLGGPIKRGSTSGTVAALLVCCGLLASWHAVAVDVETLRQAIRDVNETDQIYWNALYLYLRIAGAVWIAVESWAAIVLVRGYRLLERATALRRGGP